MEIGRTVRTWLPNCFYLGAWTSYARFWFRSTSETWVQLQRSSPPRAWELTRRARPEREPHRRVRARDRFRLWTRIRLPFTELVDVNVFESKVSVSRATLRYACTWVGDERPRAMRACLDL